MPTTPLPDRPAPSLRVDLVDPVDGSAFALDRAEPDRFTMIVFYRGHHCPVCRGYLQDLRDLLDDYQGLGVEVIAVSMDDEQTATTSSEEWELGQLRVGYGLTRDQAEAWGLYLSEGIKDPEPELFSEPGLALVRPDGSLYYLAINSQPFGRPDLEQLVASISWVLDNEYPARGEVEQEAA